jgi:Ca2+-binding EF-hand superfamily protein
MFRSASFIVAGLAIAIAIAPREARSQPRQAGPAVQPSSVYLSLMGEPFHGQAGGTAPLADWFGPADRNHDGAVSLPEMLQDAARFFGSLDLNKDGVIDFAEMGHYETVIAPARVRYEGGLRPVVSKDRGEQAHADRPGSEVRRWGFGMRGERADLAYLEVPEPVLMADTDFNRRVTPAEFAKAAEDRFAEADKNKDGVLQQIELNNEPLPKRKAGKTPEKQQANK